VVRGSTVILGVVVSKSGAGCQSRSTDRQTCNKGSGTEKAGYFGSPVARFSQARLVRVTTTLTPCFVRVKT
jgi:hypothetical protein